MTVNTWRYQLEPSAAGTDVTESFELADTPLLRGHRNPAEQRQLS
jgi:hypothetical protein